MLTQLIKDRDGGGVEAPGTLYRNFLDLCMSKSDKSIVNDLFYEILHMRQKKKKKPEYSIDNKYVIENVNPDSKTKQKIEKDKKSPKKTKGNPIGRPSKKSDLTIQRHNWIRDRYYILREKRTARTLDVAATLIRSEMLEKRPHCFEKLVYKKSTILKVLKNKSWGDD